MVVVVVTGTGVTPGRVVVGVVTGGVAPGR